MAMGTRATERTVRRMRLHRWGNGCADVEGLVQTVHTRRRHLVVDEWL